MAAARLEVSRTIDAPPAAVFAVLRDPRGHVAIDSAGMLMSSDGGPVEAVGDTFLVHMDREALGDVPMGRYDVTVIITQLEADALIEWTISGTVQPPIRHLYGYRLAPAAGGRTLVTSYYDWSGIRADFAARDVFPVVPESALRATLGILARVVQAGGLPVGAVQAGGLPA